MSVFKKLLLPLAVVGLGPTQAGMYNTALWKNLSGGNSELIHEKPNAPTSAEQLQIAGVEDGDNITAGDVRKLLLEIEKHEWVVQYHNSGERDVEFTTTYHGKPITLTIGRGKIIYDNGQGSGGEFDYSYNTRNFHKWLEQFRNNTGKIELTQNLRREFAAFFSTP